MAPAKSSRSRVAAIGVHPDHKRSDHWTQVDVSPLATITRSGGAVGLPVLLTAHGEPQPVKVFRADPHAHNMVCSSMQGRRICSSLAVPCLTLRLATLITEPNKRGVISNLPPTAGGCAHHLSWSFFRLTLLGVGTATSMVTLFVALHRAIKADRC